MLHVDFYVPETSYHARKQKALKNVRKKSAEVNSLT
jgi:hypothetical protein